MATKKFTFDTKGHFYASSISEWRTETDISTLILKMKKYGYSFSLWYVPLDEKEHYKIDNFSPVVEGAVWLGNYNN